MLAVVAVIVVVGGLARPGAAAPGLVVQDLAHGVSAESLASSLVGFGVTVSNVTYTGAPNAAGSFTGGTGIIGFESGLVMGTGSVQTTGSDVCEKGVEGPNQCDSNSTDNNTAGDPSLNALVPNTQDAAVLEFDFVPQAATVHFDYVFTSDEYNEFANSSFNDVFAFFVNGANCAVVPGSSPAQPVSINTINGGDPFGTDPKRPELYRNNDPNDPGPATIDTEMDGLTVVLSCDAPVNAGASNHMKLAIADVFDGVYDANVFLSAGSLVSGTTTTVEPGATTTTVVGGSTTTLVGGSTTTTLGGGGSTTTLVGATTTTTVGGTTTTSPAAVTTTMSGRGGGAGASGAGGGGGTTLARTGGGWMRTLPLAALAVVLGGLFLLGSQGLVAGMPSGQRNRRRTRGIF